MEETGLAGKVVIIGGSAGSLEVLLKIVPRLSAVPSYAIVAVLHRKAGDDSTLEELLTRKGIIPVKSIEDKTQLRAGRLYVAPSDYHLLFENGGRLSLDVSEKINYSRPSIDVAFESAAEVYGENLVGILLSGSNSDGSAGLEAIRKMGGTVVVQDPDSAEMPFMPQSAIENNSVDYILNVDQLIEFITRLDSGGKWQ